MTELPKETNPSRRRRRTRPPGVQRVAALRIINTVSDAERRCFAAIRAESDLRRFRNIEEDIVLRIIEACGLPQLADDLHMSSDFAVAARLALLRGAPILCDTPMIAAGICRPNLPAANAVLCLVGTGGSQSIFADDKLPPEALAVDYWKPNLQGSLVAIGSSAAALKRLLDCLKSGWPPPAAIVGFPAGFIDAEDAKALLAANGEIPFLTINGRAGGAVMTAAAVNALSVNN